jgi:hypothetical protein
MPAIGAQEHNSKLKAQDSTQVDGKQTHRVIKDSNKLCTQNAACADAACAAATTLIAPRREDMSKRLATQALTSTAAQLTGQSKAH